MEALRFSAFRGNGIPLMISALGMEEAPPETTIAQAWDAVIRSRGILLEEIAARRRLIRDLDDPDLEILARAALEARSRLANLYLRGPENEDQARFRERLEAAARGKEEAEAALAEASASFREETRPGGLDAVRDRIPDDAALVAYVRYPRGSRMQDAVPTYAVFGISGPSGDPWYVDLGPAAAIDVRVREWREAVAASGIPAGPLTREAEAWVRSDGAALREAVWIHRRPPGLCPARAVVPTGLSPGQPGRAPDPSGGYLVELDPLSISFRRSGRCSARRRHLPGNRPCSPSEDRVRPGGRPATRPRTWSPPGGPTFPAGSRLDCDGTWSWSSSVFPRPRRNPGMWQSCGGVGTGEPPTS